MCACVCVCVGGQDGFPVDCTLGDFFSVIFVKISVLKLKILIFNIENKSI